MTPYVIGALILGYSSFVIYRKARNLKAGKTCCGGCTSCPYNEKCKPK